MTIILNNCTILVLKWCNNSKGSKRLGVFVIIWVSNISQQFLAIFGIPYEFLNANPKHIYNHCTAVSNRKPLNSKLIKSDSLDGNLTECSD